MLDTPKNAETSHADGKILQSVSDGVGVITFNNPDKRNAMSLEMWQGLGLALVELRDNPDVRVVILVGAGDKAFVSGADISQFEKTRQQCGGVGGIFETQRGAACAAGELSEADDCLHPRLLPRRRHAGRDADGYPNRFRQQPVRHSRRKTRHRLWL
jgi:enoyl-CoA hydratase/carnithine racemase